MNFRGIGTETAVNASGSNGFYFTLGKLVT
jgi:hypothetical protein